MLDWCILSGLGYLVGLSRKLLSRGQGAKMYTMICMQCEKTYQSISGITDIWPVCQILIMDAFFEGLARGLKK